MLVLYLFLFEVVRVVWRDLAPQARRSRATRPRPNLEIVRPAAAGMTPGEVIVLNDPTTIGREQSNDVVVDEDTVSGHHARLVSRNGAWWIEDLGSTNGTTVNDALVDGTRALHTGDVIQMGRVQIRFSS